MEADLLAFDRAWVMCLESHIDNLVGVFYPHLFRFGFCLLANVVV